MDRRTLIKAAAATGLAAALPGRAFAQSAKTLRIASMTAPTSLDPHFHDNFNSTQALLQLYQPLLGQSETSGLIPYLATEWKALDGLTWEIKLRQGVTFHDGTPFEPEDIVFSFERVPTVKNAISPFTANVRNVTKIDIVSRDTVRFTLATPDPLFNYKLCQVCMLSRKLHANATLEDFNSGKLAIGTGPYKLVSFTPGERLKLVANPGYWGGKPAWDEVDIRYMLEAGGRMAALRAGEVDLIDNVPVQDVATLKQDPKISLFSQDAFLTIFFYLDSVRDESPFVFDNAGKPLKSNPLKDPRVRRALSLAIDRQGVVNRLLLGQGTPADQFAGLLVPDRAPGLKPLSTQVDQAKKLLAEAGYPDGFRLTIHGPNGWFASDANVLQAVAQSLTRIGVKTQVEVLPPAVVQTNTRKRAYSMVLSAFNGPYALISLRFVTMTPDAAAGNGSYNSFEYSNAALDTAMKTALVEMDTDRRKAEIAKAMNALIDDMGLIPIFFTKTNWAGRKDRVIYRGNPMSRTSAFYAEPVAP